MNSVIRSTAEGNPYDLSALFDRAFDHSISLFLIVTVMLPGGSIYGLNIKAPLYVVLLPLAAHSMFHRGLTTPRGLTALIGTPAILSVWVLISIAYGFPVASALRQYTDIVLTLLLCWLIGIFCNRDDLRRVRFLLIILNAESVTCLCKIGLIAYAVAHGIPTVQVVDQISTIFGVNLMTMDFGAMFGRVQFVSDTLIPVCTFIVLRHRATLRFGGLRACVVMVVLLASVVFSFSRYLWAFTALAMAAGLFLGRRDRFQLRTFAVLSLACIASLPALAALYQLRFSTDVAGSSDSVRVEQTRALEDFFEDAPLMGHGLGSYTNQVLRVEGSDIGSRYSYEAQLLALSGQIGICLTQVTPRYSIRA
jgi:hypothetical protein